MAWYVEGCVLLDNCHIGRRANPGAVLRDADQI